MMTRATTCATILLLALSAWAQEVPQVDVARINEPNERGWIPLHEAASDGDVARVKRLIAKGANVTLRDDFGRTPLDWAARSGHPEVAKMLLAAGAKANIFVASRLGLLDRVKELVEAHPLLADACDPCSSWFDEADWPVTYAAKGGHVEVMKYLIGKGATHLDEALERAGSFGHDDAVKFLLDQGARVNIHQAAAYGLLDRVKAMLDASPGLLESVDEEGRTPLQRACEAGRLEAVKLLLDRGADLESLGGDDDSPLAIAAGCDHVDVVRLLIDRGARLDDETQRRGLLPKAISDGAGVEVVTLLLDHGVKADEDAFSTPVELAIEHGRPEVAELLIDRGEGCSLSDAAALGLHRLKPLLDADVDRWRLGEVLCTAAQAGRLDCVDFLLGMGVKPDEHGRWETTPLHGAVQADRLDVVDRLIIAGADVKTKDGDGITPLHVAAGRGSPAMVRRLVEAGARVDATDKKGRTPLRFAAGRGRRARAIVDFLIERGAELTACDAARLGSIDQLAAKVKADPAALHSRDDEGYTPLHAAIDGRQLEAVRWLLDHGADVNARIDKEGYANGWTPLHLALFYGRKAMVPLLLEHGADVNARDENDRTPFYEARDGAMASLLMVDAFTPRVSDDEAAVVAQVLGVKAADAGLEELRLRLAQGMDPDEKDKYGQTPLRDAARDNNIQAAKLLIAAGADVNARDERGLTPIYSLAWGRPSEPMLDLLIAAGADVNAQNEEGYTPLHEAVEAGRRSLMRALIARGADVNGGRGQWGTPLHQAARFDNTRTLRLLLEAKADVNAPNRDGDTPLHFAVRYGHRAVAKLLVSRGADLNAMNGNGQTPLDVARNAEHQDVVEMLKRAAEEAKATGHR